MKSHLIILTILLVPSFSFAKSVCEETYGNGQNVFSLATGSPGELGLVKALAESFNSKNDITVCWKKAGSGEALEALREKSVDMIMVHAPDVEKRAVQEGWAVKRTLIGSNEFFIVGPPEDPAKISEAKNAVDAFVRIANARAKFFSRGDDSGTHRKELAIWRKAGITPTGGWYVQTGDFMTAALKRAGEDGGYFMTDSSTWVAEKRSVPNLKILFKGDKFLVNTYHALSQPEATTPGAALAISFIDFAASDEGQKIIRDFGKDRYGDGLYNDASYAAQYDD